MKAIVIQQTGAADVLELRDVPVPQPKAGEALVRTTAIGVNYVDIYLRNGHGNYKRDLPFVIGQEAAGVVEAVGPGVETVRAGQRVVQSGVLGSYAEYQSVPAERLVAIPENIDDRTATAAMLQGMTAQYLVRSTYALAQGDTALIHAGAGGVGLLLTQMARALGATVITTVSSPEKAELSRAAGAHHVINYAEADFEAEVKRITNGAGVAVVYDSVGKTTYEKSLNSLRPRGHFVSFGSASGPVPPIESQDLMAKGSLFATRPSLVHYVITREELLERANDVFSMIGRGDLTIRIGATYPLADAAQAHRDLESRKTTAKLLLIP